MNKENEEKKQTMFWSKDGKKKLVKRYGYDTIRLCQEKHYIQIFLHRFHTDTLS